MADSHPIDPEWLRQYQQRTGTTATDSPALRNAYRQHLYRQRRKAEPLRNAPPVEMPPALAEEIDALLTALPPATRRKLSQAFGRELFTARLMHWEALERMPAADLVDMLPHGLDTVKALLASMPPKDAEALRNALNDRAEVIDRINNLFSPRLLRNGGEG